MKTFVIAAVAALFSITSAHALTLKSGEVYNADLGVVSADETPTGRAALENDGYVVASGVVFIDVDGQTIEVEITDLQGKSTAAQEVTIARAGIEQGVFDLPEGLSFESLENIEEYVAEVDFSKEALADLGEVLDAGLGDELSSALDQLDSLGLDISNYEYGSGCAQCDAIADAHAAEHGLN